MYTILLRVLALVKFLRFEVPSGWLNPDEHTEDEEEL